MSENNLFSSVLLVEDDASHAMLIKRALRAYVDNVEHHERFRDAAASLEDQLPDLIVTDLNLPDTDTVEHVGKLRASAQDVPIIVLTSSTSLQDAVEAMKQGAQDFIVKNFDGEFKESLGLSLSRVFSTQQLKVEKQKLQKEMEILQVAISNSQDALGVVDEDGKIRYSNVALDKFLLSCGGKTGDALSFCTERIRQYQQLKNSFSDNLKTMAPGSVWNTELVLEGEEETGGDERAYDLSLSVIPTSDSAVADKRSSVIWIRDISEQRRREKFQREILSTTTHDLKGPLGAIITGTELLTDMVKDNEKASALVLRVGSAAHGVVNLIDEFLSARRLQEGNFLLKPKTYSLSELTSDLHDNFNTIAEARDIDFCFDIEDESARVTIDKLGFSRVVGNLLSNAFKFTPKKGRVRVGLSVGDDFSVEVQDSGAGMEASEVQEIFKRYGRLEKHKDIAGSGIGLFVVRCIVEAHGGKIDVFSQIGQGTVFKLSFPLEPPVNERGELISLDFA